MSQPTSNKENVEQPLAPAPPRRRGWKLVLFGIIILLCGMVIGAGSLLVFRHEIMAHAFQSHDRMHARAAARMKRRLNLSDEQAKEVEKILDRRMGEVHRIWREAYSDSHGQIMLMKADISDALPEEQAKKALKRIKRYERAFPAPPPPLGDKID